MGKITKPDKKWLEDPEIFAINRIPAHSDHMYYETKDADYGDEMPLRQSLNGVWKFAYAVNENEHTEDFYKTYYDCENFDDIKVPGHIELQGYDKCQYINTMYPWEGHEDLRPPHIPKENAPVGSYVLYFDVKPQLSGHRISISFQGVENAFYLWVNGHFAGYAEDSFTPSEFEITEYLCEKNNKLAVEVHKRSSASWLEDQDFWRFSGIFRDVYLYAEPKTHIKDLYVHGGLDDKYCDGIFGAKLQLGGDIAGHLDYEIVDFNKNSVAGGRDIPLQADMTLEGIIPNVKKWSAECPDLYMLNIYLYDNESRLVEYVPQPIGFRTMELEKGIMLLNGKRIIFKGVNRHEFSPVGGRSVTKEEMERDIKIIKSLNINAVRTSHYPNNSYWYYLCDRYGVYLIDETNLETHGCVYIDTGSEPPYRVPGDKKEWLGAVLDRAKSMLERDKNHPSVVIWSCGNESHADEDILEMSRFFHERDKSRLVHYEGCFHNRQYSHISDMESRMYAKVSEIKEYLQGKPDKPYISCEYTHAMGNSCGGMFKYTELEDIYSQYQGGFIWDFIDQSIIKDGEFMVGGDFGDRPNDNYFCGNGIVFADRKLSPKAQEVKYLYQNIKLYPTPKGILIDNENLFESTAPYIFEVKLLKDGKTVWAVSFGRDVMPGTKELVPIEYPEMKEAGEYVIEAKAILMAYREWADVGHVVSWGQSTPIVIDDAEVSRPKEFFKDIVMGNSCIGIKTSDVHAIFSRWDGGIISYRYKGMELIENVPSLSFWRAPTDNDKGNGFASHSGIWAAISSYPKRADWKIEYELRDGTILDGTVCCDEFVVSEDDPLYGTGLKSKEYAGQIAKVIFTYTHKLCTVPKTECIVKYIVTPDGKISVCAEYSGAKGIPDMAQFGILMTLDKKYDRMEFYGRGPEENYSDRCKGAKLGIYKLNVKDNLTPYLNPQECGNRHDVRWLKVADESKHGIMIESGKDAVDVKVLPFGWQEIQSAYKVNYLPKQRLTYVEILGASRGVGGDDSWGAPVHDEFTVKGNEKQSVGFTFYGL